MSVAVFGAAIAAVVSVLFGRPGEAPECASVAFFLGVIIAGNIDDLRC